LSPCLVNFHKKKGGKEENSVDPLKYNWRQKTKEELKKVVVILINFREMLPWEPTEIG